MDDSQYFEVITDAVTGEVTKRMYSPEEIVAFKKANVPQVISAAQCRLLLLRKGLLDAVEALISTKDAETQIKWKYAERFERNNSLLTHLATDPALNLTDDILDQFFTEAAQIVL